MPPNLTERKEHKRGEILKAAFRVFADRGFEKATIADIAADLGIGHGTFYRYFENKHAIFEHVIQQVITRVGGALAGEQPTDADSLEQYRAQVRRIAWDLLSLLDEDPRTAKLLFVEAVGVSEHLDRKLEDLFRIFGEMTEAYLINGRDKGFLRADLDTSVTALAINSLILEGGRHAVRAGQAGNGEASRRRYVDAVVGLMFDGIRA